MDVIARYEVEVCALCGRQRQYGMSGWCHGGIGRQRHARRLYEKVEYVPAEQLRGAVEEHRAFVEALTHALNDHGVPAMPSWREAIDYLAEHGGQ